jgi:hypothetical protein
MMVYAKPQTLYCAECGIPLQYAMPSEVEAGVTYRHLPNVIRQCSQANTWITLPIPVIEVENCVEN